MSSVTLKSFCFAFAAAALIALVPDIAHANIFNFNIGSQGCSGANVFQNQCSEDPEQGLATNVSCRIMKAINTGIIPIFCNIVDNPEYQMALSGALTLYVVLWGVMVLAGLTPAKFGTALGKLLKMLIIYMFLTDVDTYFDIVYGTVLETPNQLIQIMLAAVGDGSTDFFEYVDTSLFGMFNDIVRPEVADDEGATRSQTDLKLMMFAVAAWKLVPGVGGYIFGLFYIVIIGWMFAFISIVVRYLLAILVLNFMLVMGPIFLPTLLFAKTKHLADEWMQMIFNFMLQIVLVVAFVLMVQSFFTEFVDFVKMGMNETVLNDDFSYNLKSYGVDYDVVEKEYGPSIATSDKYVTGIEKPEGIESKEDFIKWFLLRLIVMVVISLLTFSFMKDVVPSLAASITGRYSFLQFFSASSSAFGDKRTNSSGTPLYGTDRNAKQPKNAGQGKAGVIEQGDTAASGN